MPGRLGSLKGIAVVVVTLVLALSASLATASMPTKACGKLLVHGHGFNVRAHLLDCRFARTWSARYLLRRSHPGGWRCQRYSARESRIAFICRHAGTDYYAVRR